MKMALGSLDRVDTVLKMLGMVNAVPDFKDHPKVANGMLGPVRRGVRRRRQSRALGGRHGLAADRISVEIEGIVAIKP